MTINVFISYSHKDGAFREQLAKHLAPLQRVKDVDLWFDGDIVAGEALTPEIKRKLKQSDILVALASHHYLASDYCFNKEYSPAMRRVAKGTMRVVAVLLSACDWQNTRMANYKLLPKDGKPIEQWGSRNQAYVDVVAGLRRVVAVVRAEKKIAEALVEKPAPRQRSPDGKKPSVARPAPSRAVRPQKAKASASPRRNSRKPLAAPTKPTSKRPTVKGSKK